ncbi:putative SnoaL-like aldol condensation-catalyzing enzyme [Nocardia sp. GAS34]|uniref:ester cyclase n=1 Tax=unclassified Nocardia TaxID=2637762 RepID=UPI003D23EB9B
MTTHDIAAPVLRMQECFNTRQFDRADELHAPDCLNHTLNATGFEVGKRAWQTLVGLFPDIRVTAEDVLVDGDKVTVRSSVGGVPIPPGTPQPMLIEIFRIGNGLITEAWAAGQGMPTPESLIGSPDHT